MNADIFEHAHELYAVYQTRDELSKQYDSVMQEIRSKPDDANVIKKRNAIHAEYMTALASESALRRLATDHPGYFKEGWRKSVNMVPVPKTEAERLDELRQRANEAETEAEAREATEAAAKIQTRRKQRDELKKRKEQRQRAAVAAKQVTPDKK